MKSSVILSGEEEVKAIRSAAKSYKEAHISSALLHVQVILEALEEMKILIESPPYRGECAYALTRIELISLEIILEYSFCNSLLPVPDKDYRKLIKKLFEKRTALDSANQLL